MEKRGQATLFVIVAIFIIVTVVVVFFIWGNKKVSDISSTESDDINSEIQNCVDSTLVDALRVIGLQGGYFIIPQEINYIQTNISKVAYGLYNSQNILPPLDIIENEINSYVESTLALCLNEENFPEVEIKEGEVNAKTTIKEDFVSSQTVFPVSVIKKGSTQVLQKDYFSSIDIDLMNIHKTSNEIIDKIDTNEEYFDLTYFTDLDYQVTILPYDDHIFVYSLTDPESELEEIPYTFKFAVKIK